MDPLRGSERGPGSGGAPVVLEGCGPSWVPARALGECCGIRIRVRISGSCGPGGRCGGSERGPGSGGVPVSWKAAGLPGYQRGPWVNVRCNTLSFHS